nr:MAG TPA: hypothetical protein [Caudoviricetes sp.]
MSELYLAKQFHATLLLKYFSQKRNYFYNILII